MAAARKEFPDLSVTILSFFDTMRVGEIISRVNDAVKIREFINSIALNLIVNILIVLFSVLIMFFYYWKLALIMLAIIPIYALIYWLSNKVNKKWQRRYRCPVRH